jgi:predicted HTH transcriptional regulator
MPSSLFDTVAAFLNKERGTILLGVEDNGTISGVDPKRAEQLRNNIVTASNNPDVLHPPFTISVGQIDLEGKLILYLQIPVSSQDRGIGFCALSGLTILMVNSTDKRGFNIIVYPCAKAINSNATIYHISIVLL